jgi:hypothetical protein
LVDDANDLGFDALDQPRRVSKRGARSSFRRGRPCVRPKVARTQDRLNGFQKEVAGGCHLNRTIDALLVDAGFVIDKLRNFNLVGPRA